MSRYYKNYNNEETGLILAIVLLVVALFIGPLLTFWIGFFVGWLTKIIIGAKLCEAMMYLGLTVTPEMLPWIAGALAWIGSFFKATTAGRRD